MDTQDETVHEWTDATGREWTITVAPQHLVLRHADHEAKIPKDEWARDVSAVRHGQGYIIRFSTQELEVGFVVAGEQADPFLRRVRELLSIGPAMIDERREEAAPPRPLYWPKVSRLAVWALICSSLVFVPVLGLLPAAATLVLLVFHRRRVRRSAAWRHSRMLCRAALVFLVGGLAVEVVTTVGVLRNWSASVENYEERVDPVLSAPVAERPETTPSACGRAEANLLAAEPFWQRDIDWGLLVAALLVVIVSLSVHEAAHAISAWWLGDDFARRLGRVTLNPLAHIDPIGTVLLPLILFISDLGVFGWARPVPVRVEHTDRPRRAHILISIAGPGSNLLLAAASLALLLAVGGGLGLAVPDAAVTGLGDFSSSSVFDGVEASGFPLATVFGGVCTILKLSFLVNVLLAFFNLIPIPPLDGSWVLENLFPFTLGRIYQRIRPFGFLLFLGLIYTDILPYLLLPALMAITPGLILIDLSMPF